MTDLHEAPRQITAGQLKSLTDRIYKLFELSRSSGLLEETKEDLLRQLATSLHVLKAVGYKAMIYRGFLHVFPISNFETYSVIEGPGIKDPITLIGSRDATEFITRVLAYLDTRIATYESQRFVYKAEMYKRAHTLISTVTNQPEVNNAAVA